MTVETRIAKDRITGKGQVPNVSWTHTTHHVNEPTPDVAAALAGASRDEYRGDRTRYVLAVQPKHANQGHVARNAAVHAAWEADQPAVPGHLPAVTDMDWHAPLVTGASRYYGTGTPVTWAEGQKVDYVVPLDRPKRMSDKAMGNRCRAAACNAEKGTVTTYAALAILDRMGHVLDPQEYEELVDRIDAAAGAQLARTAAQELPAIRATMGAMVWTLDMLLGMGVITSREVPALTH